MKLLIENLGPIKNNKQTIDLSKNFYVFVGENNSGKTYVSQLLWTIFNPDIIDKFAQKVELNNIDFETLTEFKLTEEFVDKILCEFEIFLKKELANTYNIQESRYENTILESLSFAFSYDFEEIRAKEVKFRTSSLEKKLFVLNKEEGVIFYDKDVKDFPMKDAEGNMFVFESIVKKHSLIVAIVELLLLDKKQKMPFFLSTTRNFYPRFYKYIYEIERKNNNFQRPYTSPENELIEKIYALNTTKLDIQEEYKDLAVRVAELMGGEIALSSLEGIGILDFEFKMQKTDKSLPMYMASSSVNQLTLLYIFFKYWAEEEGNFLIIDEPEENLNPKNQIKLLEILIDFTNRNNNKVLINTHSNILAESLNNYIYLDALKNDYKVDVAEFIQEQNLKYLNPDVSINDEKVGVYFFSGDKIIDYQNPNYGVYFRDFKDVSEAMSKNIRFLSNYVELKAEENE